MHAYASLSELYTLYCAAPIVANKARRSRVENIRREARATSCRECRIRRGPAAAVARNVVAAAVVAAAAMARRSCQHCLTLPDRGHTPATPAALAPAKGLAAALPARGHTAAGHAALAPAGGLDAALPDQGHTPARPAALAPAKRLAAAVVPLAAAMQFQKKLPWNLTPVANANGFKLIQMSVDPPEQRRRLPPLARLNQLRQFLGAFCPGQVHGPALHFVANRSASRIRHRRRRLWNLTARELRTRRSMATHAGGQ